MPTIQVLPAEVRKGDRITITGTVEIPGVRHQYGTYFHPADQPLTVDRPDPDDDLIEAMAVAMVREDASGADWPDLARAALAALREFEAVQ